MHLSQLDFELPEELVARTPPSERGTSRLLIQKAGGSTRDAVFSEIAQELKAGDLLVLNDTRVLPARLELCKQTGGAAEALWIEVDPHDAQRARVMLSGGRLRAGVTLHAVSGEPVFSLVEKLGRGFWWVRSCGLAWHALLERFGTPPLPPYIRRLRKAAGEAEIQSDDFERYQTLWANEAGSVAAPTASLHFSESLLRDLQARGVETCTLTLHVGLGTFLPIESENLAEHRMHAEAYRVDQACADALNRAKAEGRRVIAVGTTVTRVLESLPDRARAMSGTTELFLAPGSSFRWVDALLTNFHTPRSSLLALVAAFNQARGGAGLSEVLRCYRHAVEQRYRFYSYGDASLWLPS